MDFLNPVKIIVLATLLYALIKLQRNNMVHRIVLIILLIDFLTELIDTLLIVVFDLPYRKVVLINIVMQHCLWLWLFGLVTFRKKAMRNYIFIFLSFAVFNFLFIQGPEKFNYYTFELGALFYIISFFAHSFKQIKAENFEFIFSNNYLLLTAPIMFLFGMGLMFAFVSKDVTQCVVFRDIKLYSLVSNYVNLVCYALICIYIYKEVKLKNE